MTTNNLQSALELWDNGFNLFPIKSIPNLPTPDKPSENKDFFKQPSISWKKYQDTRASREDLYKWYEERPYLNIGIITNGLVIVDADNEEAVLWCDEHLSTPVVSNTAKGKHYFFKQLKSLESRNTVNKGCGIDIRANGGYVVAPPSVHGSGKFYRWSSDETPMFDDIPEMSLAEYEVLQELLNPNEKCISPHRNQKQFLTQIQNSQVSKDFFSPVEVGGRNDSLARLTGSLLGRGFPVDQIHLETTKWNNNNPIPLSEEERMNTVESIIRTNDRENILKIITGTSGDQYPSETLNVLHKIVSRGERGSAEILLDQFKDVTLYNHDSKEWLKYDNGVWIKDSIKNITWRSQEFLLEVFSKSAQLSFGIEYRFRQNAFHDSEDNSGINKEIRKYKKFIADFSKAKRSIGQKKTIENVLLLLATEKDIGTATTDFDQHPLLINLQNGYYDLEQDQFYNSDPKKRFLCQFRTNYIPEAKPEKWIKFLETILEGDQERIEYIQKLVGISLTGKADFQAVIFCFGDGKNGKSTFIETLRRLFGDYFGNITSETLLSSGSYSRNTSDYDMADLFGKRMVVGDELSRDREFNESLLKKLTGGDEIKARQPRERFINFNPTHTLWMFGNHKPRITGTDEGIWRRIKLIPFEYKIPDEEVKNQSVIFKEFEQEFPGILNWAIEGYRKYQSEGVEEPKVVLDAIKEYRSDSDTLGRFMEECCTASDSSVSTKDLFKAYESWCSSNSEYKQYKRQPSLTRKLGENGYQISFRGSRRSYLEGYKLIEEEENQIFEPEEEVEPVRESEFEEEDDF